MDKYLEEMKERRDKLKISDAIYKERQQGWLAVGIVSLVCSITLIIMTFYVGLL